MDNGGGWWRLAGGKGGRLILIDKGFVEAVEVEGICVRYIYMGVYI